MKTHISLKAIPGHSIAVAVAAALAMMLAPGAHAQINVLHVFAGGTNDGSAPWYSTPIISGSTLYGMTYNGGQYGHQGNGVLYKINTDGTGYTNLHEFASGPGDGAHPFGSLTLDGDTLYGMTSGGGSGLGGGVVFKMNTDGTGYTNLYEFEVFDPDDGRSPYGDLTLSGTTLYGMTGGGGTGGSGVVFRLNKDGTGYTNLHEFMGGADDGAKPYGSLTQSGTKLYGMTYEGGYFGGVIFRINTDGSGFTLLYRFGDTASDGARPYGKMAIAGNTLYGLTQAGGGNWVGAVFKIQTDGSGYENLHPFAGGVSDGAYPYGSVTLSGNILYGMTCMGGLSNDGTVFKINTDGNEYTVLHNFSGSDGHSPYGSLSVSGGTLYGMTHAGGTHNLGVIFSLPTGAPFTPLHTFTGGADSGRAPWSTTPVIGDAALYGMTKGNGFSLYGMTKEGGISNRGVVFTMNMDGTCYSNLHAFMGGNADGSCPLGSLALSGGTLYGLTEFGGNDDCGTAFKIDTDGTGYGLLHEFSWDPLDGVNPCGGLTLAGSALYATTLQGGISNRGTVFRMNTDGAGYTNLHEFTGGATDGSYPRGNVTLSDSTLYGMSVFGGAGDRGVVFKVNTDGSDYALLHEFAGGGADGAMPYGGPALSGSTLYGMTRDGGISNRGTVFRMNTDGTGYTNLHEFMGGAADGAKPYGSLVLWGAMLYGMTSEGGLDDLGVVFEMTTDGTGFQLLQEFAGGADGASPRGSLALWGITLYGMTTYGGASDCGTAFSYEIPEPSMCMFLGRFALAALLARRRRA